MLSRVNEEPEIGTAGRVPSTEPDVSGVLVRALVDVAMGYDVAPDVLLAGDPTGIMTRGPFDVRLPLPEFRSLLRRAVTLTREPALGLRYGLDASPPAFDLVAPLLSHVPTLRDAVREIRHFRGLFSSDMYLHLSECAGVARLRWEFPRADPLTDRYIAEFLTAGMLRLLRGFGLQSGDLVAARFEHKRPACHHVYARVFDGTETFSDKLTGLDFASHLLDRPNFHHNPVLQTMIHKQAEEYLARSSTPMGPVDRLRAYLRNQPAARLPDMTVAAREVGASQRSLRRRLAEKGVSYRRLTREMRCERACSMLRNSEFTLKAIADSLGFADTASFHRAFKRWTGGTPHEYRRANTAGARRAG